VAAVFYDAWARTARGILVRCVGEDRPRHPGLRERQGGCIVGRPKERYAPGFPDAWHFRAWNGHSWPPLSR
jgi:hypothetical protein